MRNQSDHHRGSTGTDLDEGAYFPSLERFNAFSDGVFAIAITLLVLELPVPHAGTAVFPALWETWHEFLGYFISFAFIGSIWLTHSVLTKVMTRGDKVVYSLNLILLFFVALLPFSTNLMVTHLDAPDVRAGVIVYGANHLLASLTLSLLIFYVAREPRLTQDDIADEILKRAYRRRWSVIGVNALALVFALVWPLIAVALYLVMTAMMLVLSIWGVYRHWHRV